MKEKKLPTRLKNPASFKNKEIEVDALITFLIIEISRIGSTVNEIIDYLESEQ